MNVLTGSEENSGVTLNKICQEPGFASCRYPGESSVVTIITTIIIDFFLLLFEAEKQLLQLNARFTSRWMMANKLQLCLLWLSFYFELFIKSTTCNLGITTRYALQMIRFFSLELTEQVGARWKITSVRCRAQFFSDL